jgi:hypothetical protein
MQQEQRRLSLAEFIEQRDFALERCAVLRAELAARDTRITELTAELATTKERLAAQQQPAVG